MDLLNIYDSEVAKLQEVHRTLEGRTYKSHDLQAFDREIIERFAEVGFAVDVKWYETDAEGVFAPVVEVVGRCDPLKVGGFDHDRMRHEVVNNYLGLPEADAGIIRTSGLWTPPEHRHGPSCGH